MVLAEVGFEELEREQEEAEIEHTEKIEHEKKEATNRISELKHLLGESEDQLCHKEGKIKNQIKRNELASTKATEARHKLIKGAFLKTETTLQDYLTEEKKLVDSTYKNITLGSKGDRHNLAGKDQSVDSSSAWRSYPQLIEVNLL